MRRVTHAEYMRDYYAQRRLRGLCALCGQPVEDGMRLCPLCFTKEHERLLQCDRRRRAQFSAAGTCARCSRPRLDNGRVCEWHYFQNRAKLVLGSTAFAETIKQKLIEQESLCHYTGTALVLGVNDSLDHVLSVSKHPELRSAINNVVWCTRAINTMKNDMDRDEFLAMCRLLVSRWTP